MLNETFDIEDAISYSETSLIVRHKFTDMVCQFDKQINKSIMSYCEACFTVSSLIARCHCIENVGFCG